MLTRRQFIKTAAFGFLGYLLTGTKTTEQEQQEPVKKEPKRIEVPVYYLGRWCGIRFDRDIWNENDPALSLALQIERSIDEGEQVPDWVVDLCGRGLGIAGSEICTAVHI